MNKMKNAGNKSKEDASLDISFGKEEHSVSLGVDMSMDMSVEKSSPDDINIDGAFQKRKNVISNGGISKEEEMKENVDMSPRTKSRNKSKNRNDKKDDRDNDKKKKKKSQEDNHSSDDDGNSSDSSSS